MPAGWLLERLRARGSETALVWRDRQYSYAELLEMRSRAGKIGPGEVLAIDAEASPSSIAALLAALEAGAIAAPMTRPPQARRKALLETTQAQRLLVVNEDDDVRAEALSGRPDHPLLTKLRDAGRPGFILFSSGSTGQSKAAVHDGELFIERFREERHRSKSLAFLLFDHIGGLNTIFYALANGGALVIPESREPDAVGYAIARHKVELLTVSPTFLNLLLLSEAHKRHDLASVKLVRYGTEVMPESVLGRLRQALPNARLVQTYGLTELGILQVKSRGSDSVWVKLGGEGVETKIEGGTLRVRARGAMLGYLNAPSPFDAEGWMDTEDAVEVEGEWLRLLGRKSELINVGGRKVYPAAVENALLQMSNVKDVSVYGEKNPLTGQVVCAKVTVAEPEDLAAFKRRMREFCEGRLPSYQVPVKVALETAPQHGPRFKKRRAGA